MECASELQELASHNTFVQELLDDCYKVGFVGGYFIIYGIPYLDNSQELKYGDLATPLDLSGHVIDAPASHQAWFRGSCPHHTDGKALSLGVRSHKVIVAEGFTTDLSFSLMLLDDSGHKRKYSSFEEKIKTYLSAITSPAMDAFPHATPLQNIAVMAAEQDSPLRIPDTHSSRYHINDVTALLRGKSVAIIGLGGTGSYVLDMISRTHLKKIALFDSDSVHVHTLFRIPGFIPHAVGSNKVEALAQHYGQWHAGIVPIVERVNSNNINQLEEYDFVFVCVDHGPSRGYIVEWLVNNDVPFVDCGMGVERLPDGLYGLVRVTGLDRDAYERTVGTPYLPTDEHHEGNEYKKQAQIVELNALNACIAVIRFKQYFKLYDRMDDSAWCIFDSASLEIDKEEVGA